MRWLLSTALLFPSLAFGQSTDILWYTGNGGAVNSATPFRNYIQTAHSGTVTSVTDWADVGDLADYRFIVIARPTLPFTQEQIDDLSAFKDDYGILVMAGDDSVGGGPDHPPTVTALLDAIDVNIDMTAETGITEECEAPPTASNQPFVNQGQPLGVLNVGNLVVGGGASVIQSVQANNDMGLPVNRTFVAHQGLTLVTADFDQWGFDNCGQGAKEVMWSNLWDLACDRDQDGGQPVECGGFDCDDRDPTVGNDIAWLDLDGDGYGDNGMPAPCNPEAVTNDSDCDDTDPDINLDAIEVCDGVDNNCDGQADSDAGDATEWYADNDGDGFGRTDVPTLSCDQPEGLVDNQDDCDDGRAETNPAAPEVCNNNRDDDCDGTIDENCSVVNPTPVPPPGDSKCSASPFAGMTGLFAGLLLAARRRRA